MRSTCKPRSNKPRRSRSSPVAGIVAVLLGGALLAVGAPSADVASQTATVSEPTPHVEVITIESMRFSPAVVHLHVGDRVVFQNDDLVPHTATAKGTGGFDSSLLKPGKTWSTTLSAPGAVHYACQFHPTMVGEIDVLPRDSDSK